MILLLLPDFLVSLTNPQMMLRADLSAKAFRNNGKVAFITPALS